MANKLRLDKQVVRTLTPDEIAAVGGGELDTTGNDTSGGDYGGSGGDPGGGYGGDDTLAGLTGGVVCWSVQISIAICPTGTCTNGCAGTTDDAGCTTGTAETYYCGVA